MPTLNFQKQFTPLVELGSKRQTIRGRRKRPIRVGDTLYLYTGMRTKACRRLGEVVCAKVADVVVEESYLIVGMNCYRSWDYRCDAFARADGFPSFEAMLEWFRRQYGLPFRGQLIKW